MHDSTLKEKVVKSHLAGVPTRTISEKFNVNRRSVQRWVQKASEALEEVKPLPTLKDKLDVIHQIETGMDVSSLARTLRISDQTIRNWVSLNNDLCYSSCHDRSLRLLSKISYLSPFDAYIITCTLKRISFLFMH